MFMYGLLFLMRWRQWKHKENNEPHKHNLLLSQELALIVFLHFGSSSGEKILPQDNTIEE